MITDPTLASVAASTDQTVVVEIYDPDEVPTDDGFDPANALKRYAPIAGLTFAGQSYTQRLLSQGTSRRTTTSDTNTFNFELDNLDRVASRFEFATGFEGCIVVQRLISRTLSTAIDESIILFAGRCDRPTQGSKTSLPISAKQIISSTVAQIPRRKFQAQDQTGRTQDNILFEGFPYMPQYGTLTYFARERKGGLLGFLGLKKTVTRTLNYSSFSDLDAEKNLPEVLGRAQVAATHMGYTNFAPVYLVITATSAFCEGPIQAFSGLRVDDQRFTITIETGGPPHGNVPAYRFGVLGGEGIQLPHPNTHFVPNGHFSRTALTFCYFEHRNLLDTDPVPLLYAVILGRQMTIPDSSGDWIVPNRWTDNPAAHAWWLLTSEHYYKLDPTWLDADSFYESWLFNNEYIWDSSFADVLFIPGTPAYDGPDSEKSRYHLSTGLASPLYFKYLAGDKTEEETFYLTPYTSTYDTAVPQSAASPGDFVIPGDPDPCSINDDCPPGYVCVGGVCVQEPPGGSGGLNFFLRRRYTSNIVVSEQTKLIDFLHNDLLVGSRSYLTQAANGKIKLKNKKPADWARATDAVSTTSVSVDDAKPWIADLRGFVLLDANTANSELRTVLSAIYPTSQNSVTLTASANISVVGFAGCDGGSTPATATLTVNSIVAGTPSTFTLDGTETSFTPGSLDDTETAAGFIFGSINGHPVLRRRFIATWTPGTSVVTIKPKFGVLTLNTAPEMTHLAPLPNPTVAPTLAETASGALPAGAYRVGYSYGNARGHTLMSPLQTITIAANKKITVSAITPPAGATDVKWFVSPVVNSVRLRLHSANTGGSFIINSLPPLTNDLVPDVNRTGCEVMRVETAFTDRANTRTQSTASNVLKATFKWKPARSERKNIIAIKFRDATQDFRLVELRLKDTDHIDKTKKEDAEPVNGQGIDNYNQAYRIAAGKLDELRNADRKHEWSSDKTAVLVEEGDVVAITDDGAEVICKPVLIESVEFSEEKGFVTCAFAGCEYSTQLHDDSVVADRTIPVILDTSETGAGSVDGLDFG